MPIQYKLSAQQKEEIKLAPGPQQAIADRYGIHRSTVSKIKCGNEYKRKTDIFEFLGVGGILACPGCGESDYTVGAGNEVVCFSCGARWDYDRMLFTKEESHRCKERLRQI